jgi:conjugal transfer mating pair stabilization protein TraG
METFEVFTFGGGTYLVDMFRGVVLLAGADEYSTLIRASLVLALFWKVLELAFGQQWIHGWKWFFVSQILVGVLFVPKANVVVRDALDPGLPANIIEEVPYGLAYFAGTFSRIDRWMTEASEAAYNLPDNLRYQRNGTLFASRLVTQASQFRITSPELAVTMRSFVSQCVFYDLLLGKYTFEQLSNSGDIWALITADPSPNRSFQSLGGIQTCAAGAQTLEAQWGNEFERAGRVYGLRAFPSSTDAQARTQLLANLPIAYQYLMGLSTNAADLLRQNMMINAIDSAGSAFAASADAPAALQEYAATKAEQQASSAYAATGRQAAKWVPLLKIVFQALYYGAFPLAFILMLMPFGLQVFKAYFMGFAWLASWGPLYGILNRIAHGQAQDWSLGAATTLAETNLTFATHTGIASVNNDVAVLAGYLAISVPFIALGITRGVSTFTHMAGSILGTPQRAAAEAATETTGGNFSLGNTNQDNHSYSTTTANNARTSGYVDQGHMVTNTQTGAILRTTPGGQRIVDGGGAVSNLPTSSINLSRSLSGAYSTEASRLNQVASADRAQAASSLVSAYNQVGQYIADHSLTQSEGANFRLSESAANNQEANNILSAADQLAKKHDIEQSASIRALATATIESQDFNAWLIKAKVSGSLQGVGNATARDIWDSARQINEQQGLAQSFSHLTQAAKDGHFSLVDADGQRLNDAIASSLNDSASYTESADISQQRADALSQRAQLVQQQAYSVNQNANQEFVDYLQQRYGAPDRINSLLHDPNRRAELEDVRGDFINDQISGRIEQFHQSHSDADGLANTDAKLNQGFETAVNQISNDSMTETLHLHSQGQKGVQAAGTAAGLTHRTQSNLPSQVQGTLADNQEQITKRREGLDEQRDGLSNEVNDKVEGGASGAAKDAVLGESSNKPKKGDRGLAWYERIP